MRAALLALVLTACSTKLAFEPPEPGLERMQIQPRASTYGTSDAFADGKVLQTPPPGVVSRERVLGDTARTHGLAQGTFVEHIPVPVDRAVLRRGRDRFERFCAPCHGVAGDGDSFVASKMTVRRPPSLHDDRYRAYPVGEIYQVIHEGFGVMPSYADVLDLDDRWAVVAYVRALQLSQHAPVATLPDGVRRDLEREAP